MAKATRNNTTNKEETKMAKYIVEAPEPKKGQKVSSGGIRENGKLATQFKNPVPYKEPTLPPTVVNRRANTELVRKEQARARRNEAGMHLLMDVVENTHLLYLYQPLYIPYRGALWLQHLYNFE